jgi:hypothetical protein
MEQHSLHSYNVQKISRKLTQKIIDTKKLQKIIVKKCKCVPMERHTSQGTFNEGKSASSYCRALALWVPDRFLQLLLGEKSQNCKKTQQPLKLKKK